MALISNEPGMRANSQGMPAPQKKNPYANNLNDAYRAADPSTQTYGAHYSPGGGGGRDFTVGRQYGALESLKSGLTNPEEGDYSNREALRQAIGKQIGQYGGVSDARERNYLNNQQRQLASNVANIRRQMGGTGLSRSSQANRSLGELLGASQRETAQGLNQLELQKGQELQQLAGVNQANLAQSLLERGYTLQQAQSLSNLLQQQAALEQGSILGTMTQPGPSDFEKSLGYLLQGAGATGSVMSGLGALR